MLLYQHQVQEALLNDTVLELPDYYTPEQLLQYIDVASAENVIIISKNDETVMCITASKDFCVEPVLISSTNSKQLKKYSNWADLVLVIETPTANMDDNRDLYKRLYRSLKRHGQLISLITLADEIYDTPTALEESEYFNLLQYQKFHGIALLERAPWPQRIDNQVEYREFIVTAFKGKEGICYEEGHAVIYKGPFKEVIDDGGHRLIRGKRMAVCEKTYNLLTTGPYKNCIIGLKPYLSKFCDEPVIFDCTVDDERSAKETKGLL